MTKRYLLAAFSFALALCLALTCGITLLGKTVTVQAADETPDGETAKHWVRMRWGTISADGESSTGTSSAMAQLEVKEGSTVTITARDDDMPYSSNGLSSMARLRLTTKTAQPLHLLCLTRTFCLIAKKSKFAKLPLQTELLKAEKLQKSVRKAIPSR